MPGAIFVLVGVALVAVGCWKLQPAYHVYRGDIDDVVSVERANGPVELEGTATAVDGTISSPLTETECLVYEYEVEEYQSSGNNSSWTTVDEGTDVVPFRLEDDTASVRVEPEGADLALSTEITIGVDGGEPEPKQVREFLETQSDLESENSSIDLGVVEISTGNNRRYHERRLDPGEEVYVFGQSHYDIDARETMRDVGAVIEDGPETPAFVVADSCQYVAARRLAKPGAIWIGGGLLAAIIGLLLL
ncbi:GIDE domain-containing protein [Natronobacterium texcoconense]|uniref:RING-type E3 ubiquitin transferase n=1 Tax=Natronobacterium texcoconense TaxID=1095778 RepID=A0A1H0ZJX0_NATTX|nr:GIDE domain-containing protein [Natronobacterium texcoconense]SDQ27511.1 E3 Ubiquitin ligase [Natronobacterium texcoconense]